MEIPKSFLGYKRENGRVGTRNHVVILPVDDISNACAEAVANNIKGTFAIPHAYGRLQFGADLELFFDTMIGTGKNPNVAACVVIGIEPKWTKRIVDIYVEIQVLFFCPLQNNNHQIVDQSPLLQLAFYVCQKQCKSWHYPYQTKGFY